jgi:hypothetical protein
MCEREAVNPERNGALCQRHLAAIEDDPETDKTTELKTEIPAPSSEKDVDPSRSSGLEEPRNTLEHRADYTPEGSWHSLDFSTTDPDTYPDALRECEQWVVQGESLSPFERDKAPYAPWGNDDPARWGLEDNRTEFDTAHEWAICDPRVDGLALIQLELDQYVFVDDDDVRCPETGDVHPGFLSLLDRLDDLWGHFDIRKRDTLQSKQRGAVMSGAMMAYIASMTTVRWNSNRSISIHSMIRG